MSSSAIPSRKVWQSLLAASGLPTEISDKYAAIFSSERLRFDHVLDLSRSDFEDLGITALGDQLTIKKYIERKLREQKSSDDEEDQLRHDRRRRAEDPRDSRRRSKERDSRRHPIDDRNRGRDKLAASGRLRHSDSNEDLSSSGDDGMEVDYGDKRRSGADAANQKSAATSQRSVQRLRVISDESSRALRMLSAANSFADSRETTDPYDNYSSGKMRSDTMAHSSSVKDKNLPPPEPVNNLSRLASVQPVLEPVLIRSLKSVEKSRPNSNNAGRKNISLKAVDRLGPPAAGVKQSALARLDDGGATSVVKRSTDQRGAVMLRRTIQGLGAIEKPRTKGRKDGVKGFARASALQRLGGRSRPTGGNNLSNSAHPLSRT